eukprot:CAMPEP_0197683036 /NCGR_PEP_ID=MMETSP1338-20131121/97341_1 /TAXON_ID=43686 ORGANISM="Pelagodinium beii, Strain RCC1491" /NCGR_SAMPLE_ID=MMETSP1338 /ASSEMBLY_ACC=CAM_ASM_000754 /LENGTH=40 /DNA_ID= /DNA_START= /DNA_END= /DNA_ORIENTATION=
MTQHSSSASQVESTASARQMRELLQEYSEEEEEVPFSGAN